jgi:ankyrin repeat protein
MTGDLDSQLTAQSRQENHAHSGECKETDSACCKPVTLLEKPAQEMNLWQASQRGAIDRVKYLLSSGLNSVNERDSERVTALHWAAINNHVSLAHYLLEQGAEIDAVGGIKL